MDAIIGFHNKPELPVGTIGIKSGPLMAAVGQFSVELKGVVLMRAAPHNGMIQLLQPVKLLRIYKRL